MKWMQWSQSLLSGAALVGLGAGLVSCGASNTVDYLYTVSAQNNPGQINVYRVDAESGALTQIPDSPYSTGGRNPVSLTIDGPGQNLYLVNRDDNTLVQYKIGSDAKLYGQQTVNPTGSEPVSVSVHTYYSDGQGGTRATANNQTGTVLGSILVVVEAFQPNFSQVNTGPGGVYVYKLDATGNLGTPVPQTVNGVTRAYYPIGNIPQPTSASPTTGAVTITGDGLGVYLTDILAQGEVFSGCNVGQGGIEGFNMTQLDSTGVPTGVLTPVLGSPYCGPTNPSAIAGNPFSSFLYVTDSAQNQIVTYAIQRPTNADSTPNTASPTFGRLQTLSSPPVPTGTTPDGIVVDPRGQYVYVANRIGQSVSSFAIELRSGILSPLSNPGSGITAAQPGCIIVEPALGRYVYTANFVSGNISGFRLDPNTGALSGTQNAPYNTSGLSLCVAATPHGNHAVINPSIAPGS